MSEQWTLSFDETILDYAHGYDRVELHCAITDSNGRRLGGATLTGAATTLDNYDAVTHARRCIAARAALRDAQENPR